MLCLMLCTVNTYAQKKADTANKVPVELLPGIENLYVVQTDSGDIDKLIGNVGLKQGETYMYCDSAYFNLSKNTVEAFGNVRVNQPGSQAESDYMRYVGNQKMAYMRGNVMLTDGKSHLWSENATYNLSTKIGTYDQGGTLQDSTTTLSSNAGVYNMKDKNARFTGDVIVTDPQYNMTSDDMGYNTDTKLVTFFGKSVVTSDSSVLHTSCGTYDSKNQIAHFPCRSSVLNDDQYVEADSLDHNRKTGNGKAIGNVIAIDTSRNTTLYCGKADFNEKKKIMWATVKPVLKQVNDKDSIFIRADTFFSYPANRNKIVTNAEVMKPVSIKSGKKKLKEKEIVQADTQAADTSKFRHFIGYHNVRIFSDSLQGVCDSVSYTQEDSTIRMIYNPIVWSRNSQITGDTILMFLDSSRLKKIYVPNNAFVISQSGPAKAKLFDQVQGRTLTGFFKNGNIDYMIVKPDAKTIYYAKDDNGAYMGVNEASSVRVKVHFKDEELDNIVYEQDVKTKMTPIKMADINSMKLPRFKWLVEKKPKSRAELFQ
ncbi:MAG: hypothetical protein JST82_11845 [Bacteroidetes bacterium]|nr:hypothetical protein [Bacteroidota bacterium]